MLRICYCSSFSFTYRICRDIDCIAKPNRDSNRILSNEPILATQEMSNISPTLSSLRIAGRNWLHQSGFSINSHTPIDISNRPPNFVEIVAIFQQKHWKIQFKCILSFIGLTFLYLISQHSLLIGTNSKM